MMIKQIVGKCFIFAGIFMLSCVIMGGGQADAGCGGGNNSCDSLDNSCAARKEPNCGQGACISEGLGCWSCTCELQVNATPTPNGKRWCVCS
jgi:hypothetical protein